MNKKALSINLIASIVAFIVNFAVNFFLSPYIVETLGAESYAFVKLANDFITYIALLSLALNALSNRFIMIEYVRGNIIEAQKYYSSVFYANMAFAVMVLLLAIIPIINAEKIIDIPFHLISDVKAVFTFVLVNFLINTICSVYGIGIFIKNKLYLSSLCEIASSIIRAIVLAVLFFLLKPKIYFISITALIITFFGAWFNSYYTKKLIPDLTIDIKVFDFAKIKTLVSSGIWSCISQLSFVLTEGLDLLICNLLIGVQLMGVLAISKTIPSMIRSILGVIARVFVPEMTTAYAKNRFDELKREMDYSIKALGSFINVPIAIIIVFGTDFYRLWVPSQDAHLLQVLSLLSAVGLAISGGVATVHDIFIIANKVKINSLVCIAGGVLNTVIVLALLKFTNIGVYAIAGVSTIITVLRDIIFSVPYAAKCMRLKWYAFYMPMIKSVFCCGAVCLISFTVKLLIPVGGWMTFLIACFVSAVIGFTVNIFLVLNKNEIIMIKNRLLKKNATE